MVSRYNHSIGIAKNVGVVDTGISPLIPMSLHTERALGSHTSVAFVLAMFGLVHFPQANSDYNQELPWMTTTWSK